MSTDTLRQTTETAQDTTDKLSVPALTAMVVGSMVGAGVFHPVHPREEGASGKDIHDRGSRDLSDRSGLRSNRDRLARQGRGSDLTW
jgi:hypothetical protein